MNVIEGKLVGLIQREDGNFYARILPSKTTAAEISVPITREEFYSLKLDSNIKIMVEIVI